MKKYFRHTNHDLRSKALCLGLCLLLVFGFAQPAIVSALDEAQIRLMESGSYYFDLKEELPEDQAVGGPSGALTGCNVAEQIYNYFKSKNVFQDYMIAAIIGNFMAESGLNPTIENGIGAYGLAQWLGGRKAALQAKPGFDTVIVQLDHTWEELTHSHTRAYDALLAAPDVNIASNEWERTFEISGGALMQVRRDNSNEVLIRISSAQWCV
jgi:hypothetical protein